MFIDYIGMLTPQRPVDDPETRDCMSRMVKEICRITKENNIKLHDGGVDVTKSH